MHIVLKKKKHLVKSEVHYFSVLSIAFLIYIYYKLIVRIGNKEEKLRFS